MEDRKLLEEAGTAVVEGSKTSAAPVLRVQIEETDREFYVVRIVFQEVEDLVAMEEHQLKDSLMKIFLTYLINHDYPFGKHPGFSFAFDVTI